MIKKKNNNSFYLRMDNPDIKSELKLQLFLGPKKYSQIEMELFGSPS